MREMLYRKKTLPCTNQNIELGETSTNRDTVVHCLRCGRVLTNPLSVLARIGPKCARKVAWETKNNSISMRTEDYLRKNTRMLGYHGVTTKIQPNTTVIHIYNMLPDKHVGKYASKKILLANYDFSR